MQTRQKGQNDAELSLSPRLYVKPLITAKLDFSGKYLVLLTNEGVVRIWCLPSMTVLYSSHEVLCASNKGDFER